MLSYSNGRAIPLLLLYILQIFILLEKYKFLPKKLKIREQLIRNPAPCFSLQSQSLDRLGSLGRGH